MSLIRLIMLDHDKAQSGLVPSGSIPSVIFAVAKGATDIASFWAIVKQMDVGLREHFEANSDEKPTLEGFGDGLLVISWEHKCIESFQEYQPIRMEGRAFRHNGRFAVSEDNGTPYSISSDWHIIDHHFEESRH